MLNYPPSPDAVSCESRVYRIIIASFSFSFHSLLVNILEYGMPVFSFFCLIGFFLFLKTFVEYGM